MLCSRDEETSSWTAVYHFADIDWGHRLTTDGQRGSGGNSKAIKIRPVATTPSDASLTRARAHATFGLPHRPTDQPTNSGKKVNFFNRILDLIFEEPTKPRSGRCHFKHNVAKEKMSPPITTQWLSQTLKEDFYFKVKFHFFIKV